jgi:biopolymer transport protein ExbD
MSHRAKRMERHHKRKKNVVAFNMVSLMDIFTILVFFLLVSSSDVEELQNNKSIRLPESTAEKKPKQTLVIMVNDQDIIVKGQRVAAVGDIINQEDPIIKPLRQELLYQASKFVPVEPGEKFTGEVTIMGDRAIPYKLLKKIMVTCAKSNYTKLSLAVNQSSSEKKQAQ